jgi:hypothetical protein
MTSAIHPVAPRGSRPESTLNSSQKVLLGLAAAGLVGLAVTLPLGLKGRISIVPSCIAGGLVVVFGAMTCCWRQRTTPAAQGHDGAWDPQPDRLRDSLSSAEQRVGDAPLVSFLEEQTPNNQPKTAVEIMEAAKAAGHRTMAFQYRPEDDDADLVEGLDQWPVYDDWTIVCRTIDQALKQGQSVYVRDENGFCFAVTKTGPEYIEGGWAGRSDTFGSGSSALFVTVDKGKASS